ncbi:hypothetical protein H7H48_15060 [Nitratireductor sp. B36]|uniref:hypothetical protein n=1 Tax=Nitratireductor sp. B36 TaxID=2762059 RepID=UPI001E31EBAC|nr:hypothetical protein [Nitratireductor sp. B36]MCC5780381.1 hypothetical protein [Nitratireductor sp. B36]
MNILIKNFHLAFGSCWKKFHTLGAMETDQLHSLIRSAESLIGFWWQDDRKNWCAYCGIPMRRRAGVGKPLPLSKATRDHVVPRVYAPGLHTLPCCLECNRAKGTQSVAEFLSSEYFAEKRKRKHRHQWPLPHLWFVAGLSYLKKSYTLNGEMRKDQPKKTACRT